MNPIIPGNYWQQRQSGEKRALLLALFPHSIVVGESHPGFPENEQLAKDLHNRLESKQKGISRGVIGKNYNQGNGIYNQDLTERALLVEFGGVDNHMDELNRSAAVFAEVFSEYYYEQHRE